MEYIKCIGNAKSIGEFFTLICGVFLFLRTNILKTSKTYFIASITFEVMLLWQCFNPNPDPYLSGSHFLSLCLNDPESSLQLCCYRLRLLRVISGQTGSFLCLSFCTSPPLLLCLLPTNVIFLVSKLFILIDVLMVLPSSASSSLISAVSNVPPLLSFFLWTDGQVFLCLFVSFLASQTLTGHSRWSASLRLVLMGIYFLNFYLERIPVCTVAFFPAQYSENPLMESVVTYMVH